MVMVGITAALFAATIQTLVHAMLKGGRDKLAIRTLTGMVEAALLLPFCFFVPLPTAELSVWLAASVGLHVAYQLTLIEAYKASDFSVAYPLARGIVPITTGIAGALLLGDRITPATLAGIIIVSSGLLLTASSARLSFIGGGAALCAGLITASYSLVDAQGMRVAENAVTFVVWFFVLEGILITLAAMAFYRQELALRLKSERRIGLMSGMLSVVSYSASLTAFKLLPVGAASALHITSVVLSTIVARFGLGEDVSARRVAAACLIACGAILIVLALQV